MPEAYDHCDFCEFLAGCTKEWPDGDALSFVSAQEEETRYRQPIVTLREADT